MRNLLLNAIVAGGMILVPAIAAIAQRIPVHPVSLEVHGQVRYAENKSPAGSVIVRLESFSGGMVGQILTDRQGKFLFSGLASTQYILTIHAPGYLDVKQSIDLLTATSDYIDAYLTREPERRVLIPVSYIDANIPAPARKEFEKAQTTLLENKNSEDAIRHLENAINLYPKFFEAELSLGTIYMDNAEWDKAEQALRSALSINPRGANALFAIGELSLQRNRLDEAEKSLIEGLKLENRSWRGHFTLGRVYWGKGDLRHAGKHIALTIQLNPGLAQAHLLGANILLRANKNEDALAEFEEYLRLNPKGTYSDTVRQTVNSLKSNIKQKKQG
jgi:tetratricopeptide (TPR) repeat protein